MGVYVITRSHTAFELYRIVLVLVAARDSSDSASNSGVYSYFLAPSRAIHNKTTEEGKRKKRRNTANVIGSNDAHDDDDGFFFRHS